MFEFGVGGLWGVPNGGNLASPSGPQRFGTLQDVSVEFDQQLVELRGQYQYPDDVAPGNRTIKGKTAFANLEIDIYNALFFGDTVTTGVDKIASSEQGTVPGVSTYTVTVTNSAQFAVDLGVRMLSPGGSSTLAVSQPFVKVASAPAVGQYSVSAGVYTFAAADANAVVLIDYSYTSTAGRKMSGANHLMGYGPTFEMWMWNSYPNNGGPVLRLYACRSSKMSLPMKRDGYAISDFEFQAYANAAGQVFEFYDPSTP